jgi:hypothetical protein
MKRPRIQSGHITTLSKEKKNEHFVMFRHTPPEWVEIGKAKHAEHGEGKIYRDQFGHLWKCFEKDPKKYFPTKADWGPRDALDAKQQEEWLAKQE